MPTLSIIQQIRYKIGDTDANSYAFEDSELENIIATVGGSNDETKILNASIFCVKALLAEASKRFDYKQGDSTANMSSVVKNLNGLLESLQSELASLSGTNVAKIIKRSNEIYDTYNTNEEQQSEDLSRFFEGNLT